jgi:hypothetical protein
VNDTLIAKSGREREPSLGAVRAHEEELVAGISRSLELNEGGSEGVITGVLRVILVVEGGGAVEIE